MNKKILLLLLIPVLLLVFTGCDKKEKENEVEEVKPKTIELKDTKLGFLTTFTYDGKENYSKVVENDSGASKAIAFSNEDLDITFDMYYNTMRSTTYADTKKTRSEQKYYKEYKFGDYDAYAYGNYESGLYLNILLKTEETGMVDVLFISVERIDNNEEIVVSDVVAGDKVQELLKSIKFEKISE